MSELEKDRLILELEQRINRLEGKNNEGKPTYSFSKIKSEELETIVDITHNFDRTIFDDWFDNSYLVDADISLFLENLLEKEGKYLNYYYEENLKIKFLTPIFNKIDFNIDIENINIKDFYEEKLIYETDRFIFNGTVDFTIAQGKIKSTRPYFFIQEFKKGKMNTDPEPQLLAELISAIELNNELRMKGAYIVGENWNFVILEKLGKDKYQYFVSRTFNATNMEDLKNIYKNLVSVKNEIITKVQEKK